MVEGEEKLDVSKFPTRIESGIVRAKIEEIVGNSKGESMESIAKKLEGEDKQIAENLIEALERLKLYEEDPRFVLVKKLKNCSSYKIKEKGKPSILKSYGVVPISVIDLGAFYVPGNETKPFYDSMFAGEETLKVIAPNLRIVRQTYKAKWPTKPRDFLFAQWVYLTHGGSCYIVAADCDGTADKKFIRGKIIVNKYTLYIYICDI